MINSDTIRQALQCNNPSCPCHKPTGHLHCPGHSDSTPSLSVTEKDSKVLVKCHAGCAQDRVLTALKGKDIWPPGNGEGIKQEKGNTSAGKRRNTATPSGLTLDELAKAKGLQIDGPTGLKAWGIAQVIQRGATVMRIPYMNEAGEVVAVRFRQSLNGAQRFTWRKGDKVLLYGLWRLREIREAGWVLLVEGESDCWTCWLYGIPALGLPGKSTWKPAWAELLKGLGVYLWQEPDAPELAGKILKDITTLKVISAPPDFKDLNEAHLKGEEIPALLDTLKSAAIPAETLRQTERAARLKELEKAAEAVLLTPAPLTLVRQAILSQGYGGDVGQPMITYLAATSRLLAMRSGAMPVHLLLVAQASAGKSYLLGIVIRLLPEEAYHVIDAGSPRVLIYDDADLQHRVLIFGEADSLPAGEDNPAASAVRTLLQEHSLSYKVTVKNPETGEYSVKEVCKPGPTVMISTSTRRLGYQLDTRVFSLDVMDTPDKIGAALLAQAELELNGATAPDGALIAFQSYLQVLSPWEVSVPFIKVLAAEIGRRATAARIMRDFARLTSLIKSVAIISHRQRQRNKDGQVIAQIEDYATVYELVGPMYEATLTGATKELRATVQAVEEMLELGQSISATTLASQLVINRGTASRRVNAAIKRGWIINRETKKSQPWDLQMGEPLPETQGLPDPEWLKACCVGAPAPNSASTGATPQDAEIINDDSGCCTVAGDTDESNPPPSEMSDQEPNDPAPPKSGLSIIGGHDLVRCGNCQYFTASLGAPGGRGHCSLGEESWNGMSTQFSDAPHPCQSFSAKDSIKALAAWDEAIAEVVGEAMQNLNPDKDLKEVII